MEAMSLQPMWYCWESLSDLGFWSSAHECPPLCGGYKELVPLYVSVPSE